MVKFNNSKYIKKVLEENNIKEKEVKQYQSEANEYINNVYCIPFVIDMPPTPYSSVRVDPRSMRMYVPNKKKLVTTIRNLIIDETTLLPFKDGRFPVFVESIVKIDAYLPTPKSYCKRDKYLSEIKSIRPIVTPDLDNVAKIINDGIKSFVIYDDSQIVETIIGKYFSVHPRIEVSIYFHSGMVPKSHEKLIKQRVARWKKDIMSGKMDKVIMLLQRYIHT